MESIDQQMNQSQALQLLSKHFPEFKANTLKQNIRRINGPLLKVLKSIYIVESPCEIDAKIVTGTFLLQNFKKYFNNIDFLDRFLGMTEYLVYSHPSTLALISQGDKPTERDLKELKDVGINYDDINFPVKQVHYCKYRTFRGELVRFYGTEFKSNNEEPVIYDLLSEFLDNTTEKDIMREKATYYNVKYGSKHPKTKRLQPKSKSKRKKKIISEILTKEDFSHMSEGNEENEEQNVGLAQSEDLGLAQSEDLLSIMTNGATAEPFINPEQIAI